jgi:hypothetical protein
MDYVCYFFGHTGEFYESGYHVCSRCGLHEYWSSRQIDPDAPVDYDNAGKFYRWFVLPIKAQWYRLTAWYTRHTRKPDNGDELPF